MLDVLVKPVFSTTLVLIVLIGIGCKPSESVEIPEVPSGKPKEMTLNDDGKELKVEVAQEFRLSLPENRSTGYKWELDAGELLHVVSDSYIADASQTGAGGVREYLLEAGSAGETTLKAAYIRPWEKGMQATQTFEMKVVVQP